MGLRELTEATIALIQQAQKAPIAAEKAINVALGLVYYDLEPVAKQLYPVITPLRNNIPRVRGDGGTATHWKAITGINTAALAAGVSEGNRGAVVTTSEQDFVASYKGVGLEDYVTFEADYAATNFDNVRSLAVENLLRAVFLQEEQILLLGNGGGLALGTPATPVAALVAGGSMSAQNWAAYAVALTSDGYNNSTVAGGIPLAVTRTNADGSSDTYGGGSSQKSAVSNTVTTAGGNLSVSLTVTALKGAVGYAWFAGDPAAGAAGAKLAAVTTINSALLTVNPAGTQLASAVTADNSTNALIFDGITTLALSATGLFSTNLTGTPGTGTGLTADGAGAIVEIDADLKSFWDNRRLSPTEILVSSQELINITKKIIAGGASPIFRFVGDFKGDAANVTAGALVGSYLNKFAMGGAVNIPVRLHPNVPAGTIIYLSDRIPYPLANVRNIIQVKTRREYYQIEWPLRSRKYEYGVYADELLQMYAPFAFGVRANIGNA